MAEIGIWKVECGSRDDKAEGIG